MQMSEASNSASLLDAVIHGVEEAGSIQASYAQGEFTFKVNSDPPRVVTWAVDEVELRSIISKMRRGARKAFGKSSAGWSMLLVRLEEELLTFHNEAGFITATPEGDIRANPCS